MAQMMDATSVWSGQDPNLSSAPHDDFQQYLDMGMNGLHDPLNFDFQDFGGQNNGQMLHQESGESMDTRMDVDVAILGHKGTMMQSQMPPMTSAPAHSNIVGTPIDRGHRSSDSIVELDAQIQFLQQQRQQHQQRQLQEQQQQRSQFYVHNHMVPPTPNSIEMHSGNNQFYPQSDPQQQAMFERYQMRLKEQEMAFTPLVSPAVTPLEPHFNIPEYTVPGAYFSPLSSPAIHAQSEPRVVYETRRSDPTSTPSPNDMSIDAGPTSVSSGNLVKKAAKKAASKQRIPRVRQSPIVKAQRRKGGGSAVLSPQALADIVEPSSHELSKRNHSSSRSRASTEGSENDSISPEHLSDMAPPPLPTPGSGRSPFLLGQNGYSRVQQISAGNSLSPATPASLMRLSKADQTSPALSNLGDGDDQAMDVFSLPEPANPAKPRLPRLETHSDGQVIPAVDSTAVIQSFQSLSSPDFARSGTAASTSSPQLNSLNNSAAGRKVSQVGRSTKKRSSVSSVQVSPALRPKISPSIKPLIRGGSTVSEDTASLILASKSNYQNILEGTHLPGVSYPTELSTNLTSKRTSHKIAEQGRRNRINSALQEIATLLPRGCSKDSGNEKGGSGSGDAADGKGGSGGQSANSKASTVELAIEYIKQLKQEVAEANRRAEEAEKALELKVI